MRTDKVTKFVSAHHKEFTDAFLAGNCCWISWLGEPMLYDTELFALRKPQNELTQLEYYRWVKGIRVV
jgi:hypothetical protein